MLFHIHHTITYRYSQTVVLQPQIVRLRPRSDAMQTLHQFQLQTQPEPFQVSELVELDGNTVLQLTFAQPTEQLTIQVASTVETHRTNPFNYQFEPWALHLPPNYPQELQMQLQPYLQPSSFAPDPGPAQLAQEIYQAVDGQTGPFLAALNQRLYQDCEQMIRAMGEPWPAGLTWRQQRGSCRDLTVLYMAACRSVGLAARFVSGYQEGDPDQTERDLHAWPEVYVPGGGWRGFDPIQGLAVGDRHVALAASAQPRYAAPTPGGLIPLHGHQAAQSEIQATIQLQVSPSP